MLLPYDRAGIARLWDNSPGDLDEGTQPRDALAESFIDKSIQVRFEVPLPLLSDWRTYLESTLRSALPDCAVADAYERVVGNVVKEPGLRCGSGGLLC